MRVAVIGGGIVGLSAAYQLTKERIETTLFESKGTLGGLCSAFEVEPDILLDRFYRHIFYSDKVELETIKELGIWTKVNFYHSKTGVYYGGKVYSFESPMDLLKFKPFGVFDKFRFGVIILYLSRLKRWRPLEKVSAEDWLIKNAGEKIYKTVWRPLLKSKFDKRFKEIPMSWFWNKIYLRMSTRKAFKKEMLGYMSGSFQVMIDEFEKHIKKNGTVIKNAAVKKIIAEDGVFKVVTKKGSYNFDKVISTIPIPSFKKIAPDFPEEYMKRLDSLKYRGVVIMVLKLKKPLGKFYWLTICDDKIPFTLIIEHTNLVPPSEYNNKSLIYISNYTSVDGPYYTLSDEELYRLYMRNIKKIYPRFEENDIEKWWVFRDEHGTHIPTLNYSKKMLGFQTPRKNLYIATGSQIYPIDRGVSESIRIGRVVAKLCKGGLV